MNMNDDGPHRRFEVRLRGRRVHKELDRVREPDHGRVLGALRGLAIEPRPAGCLKLHDQIYRVRVGDWRIIYRVDEARRLIDVGCVVRRSERTYRNIDELFS